MWLIIWLIVAAVMIIVEMMTLGLTTIWFAGAALISALMAYLGANWIAQIVVFSVVSVVLLVFTRPVAQKHLMKNNERTNVDALIGQSGVVTEEINNTAGTGTIILNGIDWTARSESGDTIEKDSEVTVKSVSGVKLIVSRK